MLLAIEQNQFLKYGAVLVLIVWWLYLQLPVQSVPYGVCISQLIRYAKASSNYSDFLKRHLHLRNRLLDQGYKKIRLMKLKALASWIFLSFTSFWRNSDSYEHKNKSARRGAQFVPIGMPTICWNSVPPKETNMLSMRNSSILITCSSE
jgi:hypothetical protein